MDRINRVEQYLFDFFSSRFEDFDMFYKETCTYSAGIYNLVNGVNLMDFLNNIHRNIEKQFYFDKLIPHKFTTLEELFLTLSSFKNYLNENQKYLDINYKGEDTSYRIFKIQEIKDELVAMIDYIKEV